MGNDLSGGGAQAGLDTPVSLSQVYGSDSNAALGILAPIFLSDRDDSVSSDASVLEEALAWRVLSSGGRPLD